MSADNLPAVNPSAPHEPAASKLIDNIVSSIASLYIALTSIAFLYTYIGLSQVKYAESMALLRALDKTLAIRSAATQEITKMQPLTGRNLPEFFDKAMRKAIEGTQEVFEERFPRTPLESSYLTSNITARTASGSECNAAIIKLLPDIDAVTPAVTPPEGILKIGELYMFAPSTWCWSGGAPFVAFVKPDPVNPMFVLPVSSFPGVGGDDYDKLQIPLASIPPAIRDYASVDDTYNIVTMRELQSVVLNYAAQKTGRFYELSEWEQAISKLYEERKELAPLFGVSLDSAIILRLGPIALMGITFEIWRRVRRLPASIISDTPWFALDANDIVGKLVAYGLALLPILTAAAAYGIYFALGEPSRIAPTEQAVVAFLSGTLWVILPVHLALAVLSGYSLLAIINSNSSCSIRGAARNVPSLIAARWQAIVRKFRNER